MRVSSPTFTERKTVGVPQPPGLLKESLAELLGVFETKPVNKEFSRQGVGFGIPSHSGRELAWWRGLVQIPGWIQSAVNSTPAVGGGPQGLRYGNWKLQKKVRLREPRGS